MNQTREGGINKERHKAGDHLNQLCIVLSDVEDRLNEGQLPTRTQLKGLRNETARIGRNSQNPQWRAVYDQLRNQLEMSDVSGLIDELKGLANHERATR